MRHLSQNSVSISTTDDSLRCTSRHRPERRRRREQSSTRGPRHSRVRHGIPGGQSQSIPRNCLRRSESRARRGPGDAIRAMTFWTKRMIAAVVELGSLAMVNDHLVKRRVHLDSSQKPWRCELIDVPFCNWHDVSVAGVSWLGRATFSNRKQQLLH